MIKHMIIQVSHKRYSVSSKHTIKKFNHQKQERSKATLSLEAYDLYIFLPLWQQVTKKFKMHNAKRLSGLSFGRWCR